MNNFLDVLDQSNDVVSELFAKETSKDKTLVFNNYVENFDYKSQERMTLIGFIVVSLDTMTESYDYKLIQKILDTVNVTKLSEAAMVSILRSVYQLRYQLSNYYSFYTKCVDYLYSLGYTYNHVRSVFKGISEL